MLAQIALTLGTVERHPIGIDRSQTAVAVGSLKSRTWAEVSTASSSINASREVLNSTSGIRRMRKANLIHVLYSSFDFGFVSLPFRKWFLLFRFMFAGVEEVRRDARGNKVELTSGEPT